MYVCIWPVFGLGNRWYLKALNHEFAIIQIELSEALSVKQSIWLTDLIEEWKQIDISYKMDEWWMFHYPFSRSYSSTSSSNPSNSHHNQPPTASHPLEDVERASSKMSSSSNESTNSNSIEIDRRSLGEPYFQNVKLFNEFSFFNFIYRNQF